MKILDPTAEREPVARPLAPRGRIRTVALLDIRKPRGDVFLDELESALRERGISVLRADEELRVIARAALPALLGALDSDGTAANGDEPRA